MPSWKSYVYLVHSETWSQQLQVTQTGKQNKTLCQKLPAYVTLALTKEYRREKSVSGHGAI